MDFLKIITEPNRLKILCLLKKQNLCACDIWQSLGITQNLASHHLKTLKEFELLTTKKDGKNIIYSTNKRELKKHTTNLNNFLITEL